MIRQLSAADQAAMLACAGREPEMNLFIIGDVENNGVVSDVQRLWGEHDSAGRLTAVLKQYHDYLVLYAPGDCNRAGFVKLMRTLDFRALSGTEASLAPFLEVFPFRQTKRTHLCRLADAGRINTRPVAVPVLPLRPEDIGQMVDLYARIPEFSTQMPELARSELAAGHSHGYWIEQNGAMAAVARTTAENSRSAMIVGVATHPDFRGRGFATDVMAHLSRSLFATGRTACLCYDNPEAGRIYHRMGFELVGRYLILMR
jgi:predicted GNAT family acetyltransferase